jgi:hypothetical protein
VIAARRLAVAATIAVIAGSGAAAAPGADTPRARAADSSSTTAPASPAPAPEGTRRLPAGLELVHITPPGQPPLETLDVDNLGLLQEVFNAGADRLRVILMLSPT